MNVTITIKKYGLLNDGKLTSHDSCSSLKEAQEIVTSTNKVVESLCRHEDDYCIVTYDNLREEEFLKKFSTPN